MATAFLLVLDRCRYGELILSLKNDCGKQQKKHPKTLTDMYGLMVAFEPTRPTAVSGGRNEGMNVWNVTVKPRTGVDGDHGGSGGTARKIEYYRCAGDHMKRDCLNRVEEKENRKMKGKTPRTNALR